MLLPPLLPGALLRSGVLIYRPPHAHHDDEFEPFPGADFFQSSVGSPVIEAMGYRLIEEDGSAYAEGPDSQLTARPDRSPGRGCTCPPSTSDRHRTRTPREFRHVRSAEVLLLQLGSDEEASGRASEVMALVKDHLDIDDPWRALPSTAGSIPSR